MRVSVPSIQAQVLIHTSEEHAALTSSPLRVLVRAAGGGGPHSGFCAARLAAFSFFLRCNANLCWPPRGCGMKIGYCPSASCLHVTSLIAGADDMACVACKPKTVASHLQAASSAWMVALARQARCFRDSASTLKASKAATASGIRTLLREIPCRDVHKCE